MTGVTFNALPCLNVPVALNGQMLAFIDICIDWFNAYVSKFWDSNFSCSYTSYLESCPEFVYMICLWKILNVTPTQPFPALAWRQLPTLISCICGKNTYGCHMNTLSSDSDTWVTRNMYSIFNAMHLDSPEQRTSPFSLRVLTLNNLRPRPQRTETVKPMWNCNIQVRWRSGQKGQRYKEFKT